MHHEGRDEGWHGHRQSIIIAYCHPIFHSTPGIPRPVRYGSCPFHKLLLYFQTAHHRPSSPIIKSRQSSHGSHVTSKREERLKQRHTQTHKAQGAPQTTSLTYTVRRTEDSTHTHTSTHPRQTALTELLFTRFCFWLYPKQYTVLHSQSTLSVPPTKYRSHTASSRVLSSLSSLSSLPTPPTLPIRDIVEARLDSAAVCICICICI